VIWIIGEAKYFSREGSTGSAGLADKLSASLRLGWNCLFEKQNTSSESY
jgi:hypothetical protein